MMLGARTAAWSGKVLPYDYELEYATSDGRQWFKTGLYTPTRSDYGKFFSAEFDIIFLSSSGRHLTFSNAMVFFGHNGGLVELPNPIGTSFGSSNVGTKRNVLFKSTQTQDGVEISCSIDGSSQSGTMNNWSAHHHSVFVGTIGTAENPEPSLAISASFGRMNLVGYNGDERRFIPCVKDGRVGFYDEVTKAMFYSETGTDFLEGPRI